MLQRQTATLRETIKRKTKYCCAKFTCRPTVLKMYYSNCKFKTMNDMDGMMLTYSGFSFIDMPLFTLYVFVCIQISSMEVSLSESSNPSATY